MNAKMIHTLIALCCASILTVFAAHSMQPIPLAISSVGVLFLLFLIAKLSPSTERPKHESASGLEAEVLDYMRDDNAHYAISLTGEWGSGKTWYCDNVLKPFLSRKGYSLCRISLFGLTNAKEASSKIAAGLLLLDESDTNGSIKTVKRIVPGLASSASKTISTALGVNTSLDPVALLPALPRKNCLVVLDDLERSRFRNDANALFGIVNELCENQGRKVLLVSNGGPLGSQEEEQLEKVVWRHYTYRPEIADLYDSVLSELIPDTLGDLDIRKAVIEGIKDSGVINTRAMIKARPSLAVVANSPAIQNADIDKSEREHALSVATKFAVLVSSNSITNTEEIADPTQRASVIIRQEYFEYFKAVLEPVKSGHEVKEEAMGDALRAFIKMRHNLSPLDVKIEDLLSQLRRLQLMDDDEAASIASELADCIKTGKVKASYMKEAYKENRRLHELGFENALPEDEVKKSFYEAIDLDPFSARISLNENYVVWLEAGDNREPFLDDLIKWADARATAKAKTDCGLLKGHHDSASKLINNLREHLKYSRDFVIPIAIDASSVASVFESSNGESQIDLIRFFKGEYSQRSYPFGEGTEASHKWLEAIISALENHESRGKLSNWRKEQFIEELNKIIEDINAPQNS